MRVCEKDAIATIKRMYKGTPTAEQQTALEGAYKAIERQPLLVELLEEAAEIIENCYGREAELTDKIRQQLDEVD